MPQSAPVTGPDGPERISTGSTGLDDILGGGFDADRVYLIEGRPGPGKTTLALQFLLEGVRRGERCLYVMLSERERELRTVVQRHGWTFGRNRRFRTCAAGSQPRPRPGADADGLGFALRPLVGATWPNSGVSASTFGDPRHELIVVQWVPGSGG